MNKHFKLDKSSKKTCVALGFFDGVHLGHNKIIKSVVSSKKDGLVPTVLTFSKSPCEYIEKLKEGKVAYLTTNETKEKIFEDLGVEQLYSLDFSSIKDMPAEQFVSKILVETLNAEKVFCGFNYHFGSGGKSDATTLKNLCCEYGVQVITIEPVTYKDEVISSTRIRKALTNGEIEEANAMLGRCFYYDFVITKGNQIGRTIEAPTLNQPFPENFVLPKFGVYASAVKIENAIYCGVTNIGVKPTIGKYNPLSETFVPQNNLVEMYGKQAKVMLIKFLRTEQKFDGIESLHKQIVKDSEKAKFFFNLIYREI